MSDPNALIVQHLLDRQEEIANLRARVQQLEGEVTVLREALEAANATT